MSAEKQIRQQIGTVLNQKLRNKLNILRNKSKEILKQSLQENVYNVYTPKVYTPRTEQLLNAVDVSDIEFRGNEIYFKVFINGDKMNHYSLFNPKLDPNVGYLVNEGHHHPIYDTPMFHQYPERQFIEKAIFEIEKELHRYLGETFGIRVTKIPGKPFY